MDICLVALRITLYVGAVGGRENLATPRVVLEPSDIT